MNEKTFIHLLKKLDDNDWQAVTDGMAILMIDDLRLETGPANAPQTIIHAPEPGLPTETIRQQTLTDAAALLRNYYLTHPLTLAGFNHQTMKLIEAHGADTFTAPAGELPKYTLFVEGGEVIAESPDSPRHRYGLFCELNEPLPTSDLADHVRQWLERGLAHEDYLGMNVCRYNC